METSLPHPSIGLWPVGQVVKTRPFHGCNMGSSPVRVTTSAIRMGCRIYGGLAQLVRAPASHAGGHWFESSSLHQEKPWKPCVSKVFLVFDDFSVSAYDGRFAALCFQVLPCFRSQAVLSCTPFVPWEPYKYLRFTVMSSDNIGSICCSCALTASALRLGV